jgi:hypothetical protein
MYHRCDAIDVEPDRKYAAIDVGADSSAIGGVAGVKPEFRVLVAHGGLCFFGRFAPTRG